MPPAAVGAPPRPPRPPAATPASAAGAARAPSALTWAAERRFGEAWILPRASARAGAPTSPGREDLLPGKTGVGHIGGGVAPLNHSRVLCPRIIRAVRS